MSQPTLVPYGNQMVPLTFEREPNMNTLCTHCDRQLEWHWEDDGEGTLYMHFDGAVEIRGLMWCNEECELLSRIDMRGFFLQMIQACEQIELPEAAGQYAKQLVTWSTAFELVADSIGGRI